MSKNYAKATWKGSLKEGKGTMKMNTYNEELPYSFSSRFEDGKGTNPEELIAAAHSGCFSMALSGLLSEKGFKPTFISTKAEIVMEKSESGFRISESNLTAEADVPGIEEDLLIKLAMDAKVNCPVSKVLSSVKISLDIKLL